MKKIKNMEPIFKTDNDLRIREELCSIHAINPFLANDSSARSIMCGSHLAQSLVLNNGDEKIIQTGLEKQFGENTFAKMVDSDVRVLKAIKRYNGIDSNSVDIVVETILITEDVNSGEIDYISIPEFNKLHQYFGFEYNINKELLNNLRTRDVLPKGTILAKPPTIDDNFGYKFGVNANLCLMNLPETTEDAVIINKRLSEKLAYTIYETREVEFGSNSFPLNTYGDDRNYKPFPEIGEMINSDSVLIALRDYDSLLAPGLCSINDTKEFNPVFDKTVYVKGPGETININGDEILSGQVVDIKIYHNPKFKSNIYTGVTGNIKKYTEALKRYYVDIVKAYEEIKSEHYKRYKNYDVPLSSKFHRLVIDAMAVSNIYGNKINYTNRNEPLDLYRVVFTIKYIIIPSVSHKITDMRGSKGVIVEVRENEDMPYTEVDGERIYADIVMDPSAVVSRMNIGRVYEQYFNAISRTCKKRMIESLGGIKNINEYSDNDINKAYDILIGLLKIMDTEQLVEYSKVTDINVKREIVEECITKEVFLLYRLSSSRRPYQIVNDVQDTIYQPYIGKVKIRHNESVLETKENIMIAPVYIMLLSKTADSYLSTASPKVNHYGLPISVSNVGKNGLPWRNSPTKVLSETEFRLYLSYVSRLGIAELKDRANSLETHKAIYENILNAPHPTNIDKVVDRNVIGYTGDSALDLINNIFNCAGISIDYIKSN